MMTQKSQCSLIRISFLAVFVDAGSRYEVNHTSGVTHFLHKLAFQVSIHVHTHTTHTHTDIILA